MANQKILIATTNPAKKKYLRWVVDGLDFDVVGLDELSGTPKVEEVGGNFKENAELKAREYSKIVDCLTIATDGGLVIPVLGDDWDSLLTHRFAGEEAGDVDRVEELLKMMQGYAGAERAVYFKEAIAIAKQGEVVFSCEAMGGRRLLTGSYDPKRFIHGFWAANLLYYPDLGKHYLDLGEEEKFGASKSHWGKFKDEVREFVDKKIRLS